MYKNILFFISFVIFLLLVYLYNTSAKVEGHNTITKHLQVHKENHKTLKIPVEVHKEEIKKSSFIVNEQKSIPLYGSLSLEEAKLSTKPRKNIKPISALQMNHHALKQLHSQDTIVLPDIEGIDYPLTVTHTQINSDGSISTTGSYTDEGISYTTTMTLSDTESFISLATARGLYEIETSNGVGYVYKTSDIRKHMQDSSLSDVIVLPIPQSNEIKN